MRNFCPLSDGVGVIMVRFADRLSALQSNVFADMDRAKQQSVVFG
jgi:hypothetical protein